MEFSASKPKTWWLYLLECKHNRLYTGIALDVHARFALHASGKGAKFTRANPPISILAAQPFESRSAALKAEHALKKLTATQKRQWADAVRCASC
jgi:putative endonuclease